MSEAKGVSKDAFMKLQTQRVQTLQVFKTCKVFIPKLSPLPTLPELLLSGLPVRR
jgi:hypothetical protein